MAFVRRCRSNVICWLPRASAAVEPSGTGLTQPLQTWTQTLPDIIYSMVWPTKVRFQDRSEGLYSAHETLVCGSVNAGDNALYVGGGGINRAFASLLSNCGVAVQDYRDAHRYLKEQAEASTDLSAVQQNTNLLEGVSFMCARVLPAFKPFGFCSVSLLAGAVLDVSLNRYHVYVVGPYGQQAGVSKAAWLQQVYDTALNMMLTVDLSQQCIPHPKMQKLRVCLFSGGGFRRKDCTKIEVAGAILRGIHAFYENHKLDLLLEFAYDEDAFAIAFATLQLKASP